jgi:cell division protein FtsL
MNTLVRSIPRYANEISLSESPFGSIRAMMHNKTVLLIGGLMLAIFISAVFIVYNQEHNRTLFNELANLQKQRDSLYVEWGQLLLEESTWSTQSRVQHIATQKLDMVMPKSKNIAIVQQ